MWDAGPLLNGTPRPAAFEGGGSQAVFLAPLTQMRELAVSPRFGRPGKGHQERKLGGCDIPDRDPHLFAQPRHPHELGRTVERLALLGEVLPGEVVVGAQAFGTGWPFSQVAICSKLSATSKTSLSA